MNTKSNQPKPPRPQASNLQVAKQVGSPQVAKWITEGTSPGLFACLAQVPPGVAVCCQASSCYCVSSIHWGSSPLQIVQTSSSSELTLTGHSLQRSGLLGSIHYYPLLVEVWIGCKHPHPAHHTHSRPFQHIFKNPTASTYFHNIQKQFQVIQ